MIETRVDARRIQARLAETARKVRDRAPINRKVSIALYNRVLRGFATEGVAIEGSRWRALKPATVKAKARKGYRKILQNTGALRGSFTSFYDNDIAGVGAQSLAGALDNRPADLAKIHQEGRGRVPKREMLPRRADATRIALTIYRKEVTKIVQRANR